MHQARRNIHAFPGIQDELLDFLCVRRRLDSDAQAARAQEKRFGLELMEMQRASLALVDLKDFPAIELVFGEPPLAAPSLGFDVHRLPYSALHRLPLSRSALV